ncbi:MAG: metalloregulator ArsR/SmtB family transcription factor [Oscillospiraceae bacterium]
MGIKDHPDIVELVDECIPAFECFTNPTRRDIMLLLSNEGAMNVGTITSRVNLSRPAVSHHLKILKDAGLVTIESRGNENYYGVTIIPFLETAQQMINKFYSDCKNLR